MAFIDFVKGARSKYSQETYPNSVFFASDTHELLFQGISYGWPTTMKAVKSVEINSTGLMTITYVNGGSDTIQLTKTMVGLSNVDNTADIDKPVSTAVSELVTNTKNTIDNYTVNGKKISTNPVLAKGDVGLGNVDNIKQIPAVEKGAANGVVPLNADGKIDSVYFDGQQSPVKGVDGTYTTSTLPGSPSEGMFIYTSDDKKFREYNGSEWEVVEPKQDTLYNFRKNPPTGDSSRVSILYRWDGEDLAEVSSTVALGEVTGTAYDGGKGKANRDAIVSLPGSLVSSIARGTVTGNSIIINVNVVTKSGLNYGSPAAANLTFTAATSSVAGLMSSTDKSRLDTLYVQISKTGKFSFLDGTVTPSGTTVVIKNQVVNTASGEPINTPITLPAATTTLAGVMSAADKEKLDGIAEGANKYVLPVATSSALGGIMIGFTEGGAGNRNYAVKLSNNRAYVNVPWTDRNVQQHSLGSSTGIFYLLAGFTPNSTETETNGVYKVPDFYYSPNTDTLHGKYFEGKLKGNADTATKATQDANGNNIVNTYATKKEIGTNTYTGANYVSKETNLTDAILQLDEEIKATNDNLDLEHTNAEATYAKKTDLNNYLPQTGGLMNGNIVFNEGKHPIIKALSGNWNNNINNYISGLHFYDPTASTKLGGIGYYNCADDNPANNSWIGITANVRNLGGSDEWSDGEGNFLLKITATKGVYYNTHKLVDETQLEDYLTKTSASNTYQPKGSYLTSVSIATISDLNANWDALLKSAPSGYVTRWPSISEVTGKQNLVIKLNGGSTEGTSMFTFNGTGAKSVNITASKIGAAASSHSHTKSQITDFPTTWAWGNISGKPSFATVATSGSYNDLSNKPSIPSLSGYATQSWVNNQGFLQDGDVKVLPVRTGNDILTYIELRIEGYEVIRFRSDTKSITWGNETVFTVPSLSGYATTANLESSLYPSVTFSRIGGVTVNPFLSSKLTRRLCTSLDTILGNTGYRIVAEPESTSGLFLLSFSLYSGMSPTTACEIYSCLFTDITGEDLYRLESAYPGIMNAMGTGNRFSLNGIKCKALGKGYFMLDE